MYYIFAVGKTIDFGHDYYSFIYLLKTFQLIIWTWLTCV